MYLVRERKLAPGSLEIAVCALRFLYKVTLKQPWAFDDLIPAPKKPRRLPVVLSLDEVVRFLDGCSSLHEEDEKGDDDHMTDSVNNASLSPCEVNLVYDSQTPGFPI